MDNPDFICHPDGTIESFSDFCCHVPSSTMGELLDLTHQADLKSRPRAAVPLVNQGFNCLKPTLFKN